MEIRSLTGIVRDFQADHPDFENIRGVDRDGSAEPGIVKPDLGSDNKPAYNGDPDTGTKTTSGLKNFQHWFNDFEEEGINRAISVTLELQHDPATANGALKIFTFDSDNFFPIDGKLFGNIGPELFNPDGSLTERGERVKAQKSLNSRPDDRIFSTNPGDYPDHNYHFTLELSGEFTYQGGEIFTFKGDDDLWVFINRKLAIDIGGVHAEIERSVNLDEKRQELGLELGNTYEFHLFFAERHTRSSRFRVDTSIVIESKPMVTVEATKEKAVEPGRTQDGKSGEFTIYLDQPADQDIVVNYEILAASTAELGEDKDYILLDEAGEELAITGTVTIPAHEQAVTIEVEPQEDAQVEGNETVRIELKPGVDYQLGEKTRARVTICDTPPPPVPVATIKASQPHAQEPRDGKAAVNGKFTIQLDIPAPQDLSINYRVVNDSDVTKRSLPGAGKDFLLETVSGDPLGHEWQVNNTIVIPQGAKTAEIVVVPQADSEEEGDEHVNLALRAGENYEVGDENEATVTIADHFVPPLPVVKIVAGKNATEPEYGKRTLKSHEGSFSIEVVGDAPMQALKVAYKVNEKGKRAARLRKDYTLEPSVMMVEIPAGKTSAPIGVIPLADKDDKEGKERVMLVLEKGSDYELHRRKKAAIKILDTLVPIKPDRPDDNNASNPGVPQPGDDEGTLEPMRSRRGRGR